ncbi:uncharacterized protein LOC129600509 [Paramacrobiotus metropolitanus]|uniref:uncharacterized protein LOC129600509 n=1 Tax=Paramacrobiotus metropolitanus TaxID=2943436 RepID=UPI002445FE65|nr:uncharacterized protein LOC129600509 [Paramacrobiotus metropolitanus]
MPILAMLLVAELTGQLGLRRRLLSLWRRCGAYMGLRGTDEEAETTMDIIFEYAALCQNLAYMLYMTFQLYENEHTNEAGMPNDDELISTYKGMLSAKISVLAENGRRDVAKGHQRHEVTKRELKDIRLAAEKSDGLQQMLEGAYAFFRFARFVRLDNTGTLEHRRVIDRIRSDSYTRREAARQALPPGIS